MDNGNGMDSFEQRWMQQPAFAQPGQQALEEEVPKSAIPKVVGILMIVFASLGLLWSGVTILQAMAAASAVGRGGGVAIVFMIIDLCVGMLHLTAGLRAVSYKQSAPGLAMAYGWIKIIMTIATLMIMYGLMGRVGGGEGGMMAGIFLLVAIVLLAWPIVVLALMSRPQARASCVNF